MNTGTTTHIIEEVGFFAEYYARTIIRIAKAYLPRRAAA